MIAQDTRRFHLKTVFHFADPGQTIAKTGEATGHLFDAAKAFAELG